MAHIVSDAVVGYHSLNLLCVERCEAHEDKHTSKTDDPMQCLRMQEDIDHRSDDKAHKCHNKYAAYAREVDACDKTYDAHRKERACRNKECRGSRLHRVDHKYRRHRNTHKHRVEDEQQCCRGHRH